MVIHKTDDFRASAEKLPHDAKRILKRQEAIFQNNWLDARLHLKKLKNEDGVYSFRITRRYRVLFYFSKGNAVFFEVGHRKEIYR
jgi:mRNA-degrading endonuclease RelE of RelBE toxin-antitoxin system